MSTTGEDWHALHQQQLARLLREERYNAWTHGLGTLLAAAGALGLLWAAKSQGDPWQLTACAVYGASLVAVYGASTLSHVYHDSAHRRLFRMIDQACIFLLIAGSFTPPATTYLRQGWWWIVPAAMWVVALAGFYIKLGLAHRIEAVTTWLQLVLGWLPLVTAPAMLAWAPWAMIGWFFAGGLCYTAGTLFLGRDHVPYFHVVWHLLVIAGSACHYWAIWAYCTALPS